MWGAPHHRPWTILGALVGLLIALIVQAAEKGLLLTRAPFPSLARPLLQGERCERTTNVAERDQA